MIKRNIETVKKLVYTVLTATVVSTALLPTSCSDGETYAEQKAKEKRYITQFLDDNDFVGKINVINEETFYAQDSMTNLDRNEFVLFGDDGVYMQIVRKGEGPTMVELAKDRSDSTITRPILCKFLEYDIEAADTTLQNIFKASVNDKMLCTYSHYSRSYTASFTEGSMKATYNSQVPAGWLKPLNYIKLTKVAGEEAQVRLIVPHTSGTTNASGHVLPFYYEITYQIPPNY
jgi:hypothetical protein